MRISINLCLLMLAIAPAAAAGNIVTVAGSPPASPQRVATLDFVMTEIAVTLGIDPVGVARPAGYRQWVGVLDERLDGATDLGLRHEPSLEALAGTAPDLIVGTRWRHGATLDMLRQVAPTLLYHNLPAPEATDQLTRMRAVVRDLGRRTGREAEARTALASLDDRLAATRERLRNAGLLGTPVVIAQHAPGTTRFHLYSANSLGAQLAEAIGLDNTWDGKWGDYGYETVRAESLANLGDSHLLLMVEPGDEAFANLKQSPVWQELPPVAGDRIHRLPPYTWFFGGPVVAARLGERFADALLDGAAAN
ncbi:iron-siderophore ABC transporter substrate-binding protein [Arhodomonas sp. AD133]|uniref:iron-siderophore ABC transporter substrate-binding protein n=1 Tax=Arhodomonas sp. AD133 TaxID=3415009 RepID=UPI003EBD6BA2